MLPPARPPSAAFGLVLAIAGHAVGWPIPRGGAQRIASALAAYVHALDGEIVVDSPVRSLGDLPPARAVLLDLTPRQVLRVARDVLPGRYCHQLARYRYGPGVFKVDWALDGAIPWRDPAGGRAGTIHLGGTFEEIARGEAQVAAGRVPERLFVLLSQPTRFDPSRAPAGKHTAWAYCHVPHGYSGDMTAAIEAEVERAAPGFRDLILARHAMGPPELERHNPNLVGGDIAAGVPDLKQLLFRPVLRLDPYATPNPRLFICSSATPPGPGVHGLCGYFAARSALRRVFGKRGLQIEG